MPMLLPYVLADGGGSLPIRTAPILVMRLAEFFLQGAEVLIGPYLRQR